MSKKSIDSIAANQYKLVFDVDRPTFEAAINKVFKKQNKNITIPGFRKGHARYHRKDVRQGSFL